MRRLGFTATRFAVIGLAIAATGFAGTGFAVASTPACQPWNSQQPGPGTLVAVAALPNCEVWAVGGVSNHTLSEHLFGQSWTQVSSPNPARATTTAWPAWPPLAPAMPGRWVTTPLARPPAP